MSIEFLQQPPRKADDVEISFPFEQAPSGYERDGFDPIWAQYGDADAGAIFMSMTNDDADARAIFISMINGHPEAADSLKEVDYGLMKLIVHGAAKALDESVRDSYIIGADRYFDRHQQAILSMRAEFDAKKSN